MADRYNEWQLPSNQATYDKILKGSKDHPSGAVAEELIRGLAFKAAAKVEGHPDVQFGANDSAAGFTCLFNQCTKNKSMEEDLYKFYCSLWEEYLREVVAPSTSAPETNQEKLVELSIRYKQFMKLLKVWPGQIFKYLDRFFTPKRNLPTTKLVGYQRFREIIFSGKESGVKDAVLNLIYRDREGEPIDRDQLKTVIRIFVDCGLKQVPTKQSTASQTTSSPKEELSLEMYEQDFEVEFLAQTREYYQNKSGLWTQEDTFPDYMRKAEKLYEDERARRVDYLHESTEEKLLSAIDDELVGAHQTKLLNNPESGYVSLLNRFNVSNGADLDDLKRVYRLFKRLAETEDSGVIPMANQTRDFIQKVGLDIIHECECKVKLKDGEVNFDSRGRPDIEDNLDELISKLADRYRLYDMLVTEVFEKDVHFQKALKAGFDVVMNQEVTDKPEYTDPRGRVNQAKMQESAVLLADHISALLCKTGNDDEILPDIQTCVTLFTHLRQKDLYIMCHSTHLARRLLTRKTVNMDWEQQTVQWIRIHTGARMVSKMEVMLQDQQGMDDLSRMWQQAPESDQGNITVDGIGRIKMDMKVLRAGMWPSFDLAECAALRPHPAIAKCFNDYSEWYLATKPKSKLDPFWKLSNCELGLFFTGSRRLATMNVPQACIMLLFAEEPKRSFTVKQIKELVGYNASSVGSDIEKLFKNKARDKMLLRLHQADKKVRRLEDNDQITLNDRYRKGNSARIDLTSYDVKISASQKNDMLDEILKQRSDAIDSCIVRTMKRETKQTHQQLIGKVIRELQIIFPCPPEAITMRIETLSNGTHTEGVLLKKLNDEEYQYQPDGKQ
eukprot:TRINITY_DN6036_c0_g5_i1.p1 TRINITY_DN6036_c0_g5~~TRINITY_DN6036_c0_g5_i1.p1  ORF type:complete len:840 (+),score=294.14 TRINITY_DN6036_c0_g5_i1:111-2630(+)